VSGNRNKYKIIVFMITISLLFSFPLWSGAIKGKVTTKAKKKIPRRVAQRYPGKHSQPAKPVPPLPAVVMIMGKVRGFPAPKPAKTYKIAQEHFEFKPNLLVIPVSASVEFPNLDAEFHNVFSYSKLKRFDLGRYHQGESKTVKFGKPGIGKIYCEIHEWMRAAIVVVESPFYATADKEGNYIIDNIPEGTYRLLVWKMDHKRAIQEVKVPAKGTVELNFSLPHQRSKTPRK
jgi:plastocyanin